MSDEKGQEAQTDQHVADELKKLLETMHTNVNREVAHQIWEILPSIDFKNNGKLEELVNSEELDEDLRKDLEEVMASNDPHIVPRVLAKQLVDSLKDMEIAARNGDRATTILGAHLLREMMAKGFAGGLNSPGGITTILAVSYAVKELSPITAPPLIAAVFAAGADVAKAQLTKLVLRSANDVLGLGKDKDGS